MLICRAVSSSAIARASGRGRASRSSLVTTSVSTADTEHARSAAARLPTQRDEMGFLAAAELRLLAAEPSLGLGDLRAFLGPKPDQSDSNSATMASTLYSSRPTASVGS